MQGVEGKNCRILFSKNILGPETQTLKKIGGYFGELGRPGSETGENFGTIRLGIQKILPGNHDGKKNTKKNERKKF